MFCSFLTAQQPSASATAAFAAGGEKSASGGDQPQVLPPTVHGNGITNYIPLWTAKSIIGESVMFQSGHSIGIGTKTPAQALDLGNNNNMVIRVDPGNDTTEAIGGYSLVGRGAKGVPNTWWTLTAPVGGGFGVPVNSYSIWQYPPNSIPGCCLNRLTILAAEASTDTGGTMIIDQNGNLDQTRSSGGAVKAMLHFSPFGGARIISCFNSTLFGAAATKPPCGFGFDVTGTGDYIFDFGFEVADRFYSATPGTQKVDGITEVPMVVNACGNADGQCIHSGVLTNNQVELTVFFVTGPFGDTNLHLVIY